MHEKYPALWPKTTEKKKIDTHSICVWAGCVQMQCVLSNFNFIAITTSRLVIIHPHHTHTHMRARHILTLFSMPHESETVHPKTIYVLCTIWPGPEFEAHIYTQPYARLESYTNCCQNSCGKYCAHTSTVSYILVALDIRFHPDKHPWPWTVAPPPRRAVITKINYTAFSPSFSLSHFPPTASLWPPLAALPKNNQNQQTADPFLHIRNARNTHIFMAFIPYELSGN